MMRIAKSSLVLLVSCLVACGGDQQKPVEIGNSDLEKGQIVAEKKADDKTSSGSVTSKGKEEIVDPAERQRRANAERISKALKGTKDPFDRAELLLSAVGLGKSGISLWPEVEEAAGHKDPELRAAALQVAAAIGPGRVRSLLEKALKDDEDSVRSAAVEAWKSAEIESLDPLLTHLADEYEDGVRFAILLAVRAKADPAHEPRVAAALDDLDARSATVAVEYLRDRKAASRAPKIAALLDRDGAALRTTAAKALQQLGNGDAQVLKPLVRALIDEEEPVRRAAHEALKSLTHQEFDYDPAADAEARTKGAEAWRKWVDARS